MMMANQYESSLSSSTNYNKSLVVQSHCLFSPLTLSQIALFRNVKRSQRQRYAQTRKLHRVREVYTILAHPSDQYFRLSLPLC